MVLESRLTLSKVQEIKGSGSGFTSSLLTGTVGQTVLYQITAKNTRQRAAHAQRIHRHLLRRTHDLGRASGRQPLAPGDSTTYSCSAKLKEIPENGKYLNVASVAGTAHRPAEVRKPRPATRSKSRSRRRKRPASRRRPRPGSGTTGSGGGSTGTLGGSTKTGSTGSTGDPKSGTLGAKSSKKRHHKVTVEHKTPKFTGCTPAAKLTAGPMATSSPVQIDHERVEELTRKELAALNERTQGLGGDVRARPPLAQRRRRVLLSAARPVADLPRLRRGPARDRRGRQHATGTSTTASARWSRATPTPRSCEALRARAPLGTHFAAVTEDTVAVAEDLAGRFGLERWRFVNSGSEATMDAIRIARALTGRDTIVKIFGSYHGHHDARDGLDRGAL